MTRNISCGLMVLALSQTILATPEDDFRKLRDDYVAKYKPLVIESETAWWEASTTGDQAAFDRRKAAQGKLVELHSDKARFKQIEGLKFPPKINDLVLARELDVIYRNHLSGQADPELQKQIIALETKTEQLFNAHRGKVQDKELSENDIRKILSESKNSDETRAAWKAYMQVGDKITGDLAALVQLRNELASRLGFKNFFEYKMKLQELESGELVRMFDELDTLTGPPFAQLKKDIDTAMAARFGVKPEELRPWHFGDLFFQEAPTTEGVDFDDVYKVKDMLVITKDYYNSMGLPADDILARSDLYEKKGKSPHAFCSNLNRSDDIRVLCNLKPNAYWADTLVHELGHGVYDKFIGKDIPFLLHEPSHSLTTEGYAMMKGAMTKNEDFLVKAVKVSPGEAAGLAQAARKALRAEKLIFARWAQVMMRFEKGMYENPSQDLGDLWWSLKKKYQILNPPETTKRPDYAAKVHVVTHPVYYHSYLLGELFGTQVHAYMAKNISGLDDPARTSFYGDKKAGEYLKEKVFGPGNLYPWNELTKRATGEPLSPKAFAAVYLR